MPSVHAVVMPADASSASLFRDVLSTVAGHFPEVFAAARIPADVRTFERDYGTTLARFEAARVRSPQRVVIARELLRASQQAFRFGQGSQSAPLSEYLAERAQTPNLSRRTLPQDAGLAAELPFDGRFYRGDEARAVIDRLRDAQQLTQAAHAALLWSLDFIAQAGGTLDLRGERFVLFGAGAELAASQTLLRAGAEVLWIDLAEPGRTSPLRGGAITRSAAANLLEQPREIAAAVRAFASEGPVHVGMFAFAAGEDREWRLGAAMNAILASLEPELVCSVSTLISPTMPSVLCAETKRAVEQRRRASPAWQRALARTGLLRAQGHLTVADTCVSLSSVSAQGVAYQAAQYLGKQIACEVYAVYGTELESQERRPVTVSANVGGVTRTRSLSNPLFSAAFLGAESFGVRVFDPASMRALAGLMLLHDLYNPHAQGAAQVQPLEARDKAAGLSSQQLHGGVFGLPWRLEGVIRAAAAVGVAGQPSMLLTRPTMPVLINVPAE